QKAADAAILLHGWELIAASSQNFVGVSLMAHVPHQPIGRSVEGIMKRYRQFHRAQRSPRVPAYARHRFEYVLPYLVRDSLQLVKVQFTQIERRINVLD